MHLIGYPSGQIIEVHELTFDYIKGFDEIKFDDEWTKEKPNGQWGFNDEDEDVVRALTLFVGEDLDFDHDYLEHQLEYFEIDEGLVKLFLNGEWVATFEVWVDSEDGRRYLTINHTIVYLENLTELSLDKSE